MMEKPPLGLTPKFVRDMERAKEIYEAVGRYVVAEKPIPLEWVEELNELLSKESCFELSASEALYGFLGRLTSQVEQLTLSCTHDPERALGLLTEFCEDHGLPEPRRGWDKHLKKGDQK